jgi:hypothetical protein
MYNNDMKLMNELAANSRLEALNTKIQEAIMGKINLVKPMGYVNNHIHTIYSFSPYSPTRAIWEAKMSGLATAGIVDHDSIAGANEFIIAGKLIDMPVTVGIECRVSMKETPFASRRLNNTDQVGIAYVAIHGIPHHKIDDVEAFIKPYRDKRHLRNRKMVDKMNTLFGEGFMSYDEDVIPLSMADENGSITERHLMFALGKKMISLYGKGLTLLQYLEEDLRIQVSAGIKDKLMDEYNPFYDYDLLGLLKGNFVKHIYVDAHEECPDVKDFVTFAKSIGGISAYAYLGDVKDSVTGDKADMKFEDDFLDELMAYVKEVGFSAVTYMPSRNTKEQLTKLRSLCESYELFQISGEDINQPRQSFTCEALLEPEFANLVESTWALIGHEQAATEDISEGMFTEQTKERLPDLQKRIAYFASIGRD